MYYKNKSSPYLFEEFLSADTSVFHYTGDMYVGPQPNTLKCWCGNTLNLTDRLSEKSCETNCPDNQPSICNPPNNIKVFSTGSPGLIPYIQAHITSIRPDMTEKLLTGTLSLNTNKHLWLECLRSTDVPSCRARGCEYVYTFLTLGLAAWYFSD